jgi:DNA polymerase V
MVHRLNLTAGAVVPEHEALQKKSVEQLDLFVDYEAEDKRRAEEKALLDKEKRRQKAMLAIKQKYGKNAILRGMSLEEGATAKERNQQIGGHKA